MQKLNYTKKVLAIILLLILQATTSAQNRNTTDSLKNITAETSHDTVKIQAYIQLSCEYENYDLDTALYYSDRALKKSLNINYKKGVADAYRQKGILAICFDDYNSADSLINIAISICREINYPEGIIKCFVALSETTYKKGEYRLTLEYLLNALKIAEDNNYKMLKSLVLGNLGLVYLEMGDYEKAIKYNLNILKIFEELNDKRQIANCNLNIGCFYIEIEELNKSMGFFNNALKSFIELNDKRQQSKCFTNIGIVYKKQKKYKEALLNFNKALEIDIINNDTYEISADYNHIGTIYSKFNKNIKANEYFAESLKIKTRLGDKIGMASCYLNIACVETKLKNYKIAEVYCIKSIELYKQNKVLNSQRKALEQLTKIYNLTGQYKKAFNTQNKAIAFKDSLFNIEKIRKITQLEEKYLTGILEKQNLKLKYENKIQQSKIYNHKKTHKIYFTGLFLSLFAVSIILIQYKKKNNAYKFLVKKNINLLNKEKELKDIKEQKIVNKPNNNKKTTVADNLKEDILNKLIQLLDNEKIFKKFNLSIEKLAKQLQTNKKYLSIVINEEFGINYIDFINEYRIKESMFLLSDPEKNLKLSISGIAEESGFKSLSSFYRTFKNYTGITPSKFRQEAIAL
ncbi:MAG: tetratricopeptide repeat protein [Bacteroidales bacterium]|nr:tetratricopeptide repeat protein [Bacteroidales bacterium]